MDAIEPTTDAGLVAAALIEWAEDKAQVLIDEINADIAILDDSPTNAQVVAIVRNSAVRQRKIINGVIKLVKKDGL